MSKPLAVLISDIHFSLSTLELATKSLEAAYGKAAELGVPLVVAGDLHDGKAIIRAEVANRLIRIFSNVRFTEHTHAYIMVGNHDLANEKGEEHGLNYLRFFAHVVDKPEYIAELGSWLIPYQNNSEKLKGILAGIPKGSRLIMHQGVVGAFMGEYVQDKTSLPKEEYADFRVISGHYHRAQNIKCGRPRKGAVGLFSFIGSPYSVTNAEAFDGPKGFQILNDDGILTQVPCGLRSHRIFDMVLEHNAFAGDLPQQNDLVWVKLRGAKSELLKVTKASVAAWLGLRHTNFKLDKIATDVERLTPQAKKLTGLEVLDALIAQTDESPTQKQALKLLAKELLSEA